LIRHLTPYNSAIRSGRRRRRIRNRDIHVESEVVRSLLSTWFRAKIRIPASGIWERAIAKGGATTAMPPSTFISDADRRGAAQAEDLRQALLDMIPQGVFVSSYPEGHEIFLI
jgi:hypothetical protein